MTDILMLNIEACLNYTRYMPSGYLTRNVWIDICSKIKELTELLDAKNKQTLQKSDNKDGGEEVNDYDRLAAQMNFKQIIPTVVNILEKLENQLH